VRERGGYELVVVPRLLFVVSIKLYSIESPLFTLLLPALSRVSDAVCVQPYKVAILG